MLPLSDGIPARRFPIVNVLLIVANFAVFTFYELPHLNTAVYHASFYPCSVNDACRAPEPWGLSWITAMFLHGGWDRILGNMLFLAIFGKNVKDAFGSLAHLVFYFAAMMTPDRDDPALRPRGRHPGAGTRHQRRHVLGAHFVPTRARGSSRTSSRSCVAFFAHVDGFILGLLVARLLGRAGRAAPREQWRSTSVAPRDPRRNRRSQTPVADMRAGAGSGIVSLVINYQQ